MITGSVIVGSADAGLIVWTPAPGMLKLIVSVPGVLLAQLIASRSEPGPVSLVPMTIVLQSTCTEALALNSDVLPLLSVAVAMILSPAANVAAEVNVKVLGVFACAAE